MGFGFLKKVGSFAGDALRKVGHVGSQVVSKVAHLAVPAYRAANSVTGGLLGNAIESIPVVGGVAKTIGKVLGNTNLMNKISGGLQKIGAAGQTISSVANSLPGS